MVSFSTNSIYDLYIGKQFWSNFRTLGTNAGKFRHALAEYLHVSNIFLLDSGRSALYLAMKVLACKGSRVLVNAYTTDVVHNTILAAGATPYPYDIIPETLEPDLDSIRMISSAQEISAIIQTGLFGLPCNPSAVLQESRMLGIPMVEDACNSLGTNWQDASCGSFGDLAILSFRVGKPLSSGGGALVTNNPKIAREIEQELPNLPEISNTRSFVYFMRNLVDYLAFQPIVLRMIARPLRRVLGDSTIGRKLVRGGVVDTVTLPRYSDIHKMGAWQVLLALSNFTDYRERIARRKKVAQKILTECKELPLKFLVKEDDVNWNGLFLPALLPRNCADDYVARMRRFGFDISRFHHYVPMKSFSQQDLNRLPGTEMICQRLVCIPCTPRMNNKLEQFFTASRSFFKEQI